MPEETVVKNRRKKIIIASGLQFRYVFVVLLAMLLVSLLDGFIVYKTIWVEMLKESHDPFLTAVMKKTDIRIACSLGASLLVMMVLSIYMSHKIAGPIYRIKHYLADVAKGDLSFEMRLRKGDELTDLVEEFNKMIKGLREIIGSDRQKVGSLKLQVEETLMALNKESISPADRAKAADSLKELILKLKEITGQFKI
jgi:methyl-accepting chemotaxis protein